MSNFACEQKKTTLFTLRAADLPVCCILMGVGTSNGLHYHLSVHPCMRVCLQDRRSPSRSRGPSRSRSRSRSGSYSRSRSRSYSRSRSRSRLRSRSPRRFNRSVTPPPRRGFGLRADQQGRADGRRSGPAPVHGIPPPGSGPAPPAQPPQPYGVLPPVSAFPPSSGAFGQMAPNPLAGMFQPLPAAPPSNPMLMNQQVSMSLCMLLPESTHVVMLDGSPCVACSFGIGSDCVHKTWV